MRIADGLHLVMSGGGGFDLTDSFDCNVFVIRSGEGWVMFDAGSGRDTAKVEAVLQDDGIDPATIRHLFLTHGHADHSGGASYWRQRCGLAVHAGALTAPMVSAGDERAISLDRAREAGIYPADYRYEATPVDDVLADGETVRIGGIAITAVSSPGHSRDHVSYLVETGGSRILVGGDALFHGGKVAVQDIADCDISAICETVRRLHGIPFYALLPGHLAFSLARAHRHAEAALAHVKEFRCPPSII